MESSTNQHQRTYFNKFKSRYFLEYAIPSLFIHHYIHMSPLIQRWNTVVYVSHCRIHSTFSNVRFQMYLQSAYIITCKITYLTFIWFSPLFWSMFHVRFHVCPQIGCKAGCIIALIAFMRLFACVYHQMSAQIASMSRCIVTFIAFVWFVFIVCHWMCFQSTCSCKCFVTMNAFIICNFLIVCC